MRADRLVALILLLRQRGQLSARELSAELEVSERTILRDIEALSAAGVPVYSERGRHGGFALLPGFRTELTGLTADEALALLSAGAGSRERVLGLGAPLGTALRKVLDALPSGQRERIEAATSRLLVEPPRDLLGRAALTERLVDGVLPEVRRAVVEGRRLRIDYAAEGAAAIERVVDPIGLVTVRGRGYLLALRDGEDRTYRLDRIHAAAVLEERARRPEQVDLERIWAERMERFRRARRQTVCALALVREARAEEAVGFAAWARPAPPSGEEPTRPGWTRLELGFDDLRHALWGAWGLELDVEVLAPRELRAALLERAAAIAERNAGGSAGDVASRATVADADRGIAE